MINYSTLSSRNSINTNNDITKRKYRTSNKNKNPLISEENDEEKMKKRLDLLVNKYKVNLPPIIKNSENSIVDMDRLMDYTKCYKKYGNQELDLFSNESTKIVNRSLVYNHEKKVFVSIEGASSIKNKAYDMKMTQSNHFY
eukprot:CAMPEP_0116987728 /NCGR_PEP_ID=MMETSP0467-20121206/63689_1 /TAXON_ID=283647 /ORGANISM="Mesodinium pulex, Strain SPMC105" /LENGTH=140 /DNA_ID=CAMNT_0004683623 /DNA_START=491 /DNA_END=913 /DNA_ORIENTATION=-